MELEKTCRTNYRSRSLRYPVGGIVMTPLKRRVLMITFLCRVTNGSHYDPLFASVKTRNQCLRKLYDFGYLDRIAIPTTPFGAPLYRVTKAGAEIAVAVLAESGLDLDADEIRAICRKPSQIDHALRIANVYAALFLRERLGDCVLEQFLPEQVVRVEYEARSGDGQRWRRRCFAPDGGLVVAHGGVPVAIALEIDMATVDLSRFAEKCRSFAHVASARLEMGNARLVPAALAVVTTTTKRMRRLKSAGDGRQASPVIFATFDEIDRSGFAAEWSVAGSEERVTIGQIVREIGGR